MSLPLLLSNITLEVLAPAVRQEPTTKSIWIGKEGMKQSLFLDDMSVYVENPTELTKTLELVSHYNQVTGDRATCIPYSSQLLSYVSSVTKWNLKLKMQCNLH